MVAGCVLAEFAKALVPEGRLQGWLGGESGLRGLLLASLAGVLTPGGPFAAFPLVVALRSGGADIGAAVAYVTAWAVLGLQRFAVYELPLMGPDFAWLRLAVSVPMPLIAGALARAALRGRVAPTC